MPTKRAKTAKTAARKTTAKTTVAAKQLSSVAQPHGGALNSGGTPGNKGGTGRPPNWLREKCDSLLADPESWQQVEEILKNKDHAAFATMWRTISERAHGKPAQAIDVSGNVTVTLRQLVLESLDEGETT